MRLAPDVALRASAFSPPRSSCSPSCVEGPPRHVPSGCDGWREVR